MKFSRTIELNKQSQIVITIVNGKLRLELPTRKIIRMDTTTADDLQAALVEAIESIEGYYDLYGRYEVDLP